MSNDKKKSSLLSGDGLFIPNRQLSVLTAGVVAILFCVFMGGYFVGKNHMLEDWMLRVENGSFADQIYTSLYARYDHDASMLPKETAEETESMAVVQEVHKHVSPIPVAKKGQSDGRSWYAPLVGYPHEKAAVAFADKLHKKGIAVVVKKIPSTTPQGTSKKYWYQVVTAPYTDRTALEKLIDIVAREEKLKNVDIKEIKS